MLFLHFEISGQKFLFKKIYTSQPFQNLERRPFWYIERFPIIPVKEDKLSKKKLKQIFQKFFIEENIVSPQEWKPKFKLPRIKQSRWKKRGLSN